MPPVFGLKLWDPFADVPTEEEYLARKAYQRLLEVTGDAPYEKRARLRGDVAKRLIKARHDEGDYKQAMEMWKLFNKQMPKYVTEGDRPVTPKT